MKVAILMTMDVLVDVSDDTNLDQLRDLVEANIAELSLTFRSLKGVEYGRADSSVDVTVSKSE